MTATRRPGRASPTGDREPGRLRVAIAGMAVVVLLAAVAAAAGWWPGPNGSDGQATATGADGRPIVVTRSEGAFPPRCGPRQVGKRLHNFSNALRTVDARALRRYWTGDFRGFLVARREKVVFRAFTYNGGLRKLRRRGGLRLRFDEVEVARRGSITFQGIFRRRDGKKRPFFGKAGLHCGASGHVQMGVNFGPWANHPAKVTRCPEVTEPVPKRAMIVCSRRKR